MTWNQDSVKSIYEMSYGIKEKNKACLNDQAKLSPLKNYYRPAPAPYYLVDLLMHGCTPGPQEIKLNPKLNIM
jgi:hypothetical protein